MPISEVYNVDCLEYMRSLPDKYFDLCIADPPFAIGISMNPVRQAHKKKDWDKQQPFDFSMAMCEYAWSNIDKPAKIFRYRVQKEKNKIHPTQKPVALYAWLLDNYAKVGDKIFDPFLGSGSSRIATFKKGFDFYACELDKDYYEAQEERFRKECFGEIKQSDGQIVTQTSLF